MKNTNRLKYFLIVIITIWLIVLTVNVFNKEDNNKEIINAYNVDGFSTDFTKIIADKKSSIVSIMADNKVSSGFIYSQDDNNVYIVCTYHGIVDSFSINVVLSSGISTSASILGYNQYADVALLKIEIPFDMNALELTDSLVLSPGEFLINIGTPSLEYAESIELGMFSAHRTILNNISIDDIVQEYYLDSLQLTSNLKPGYSGSPLLNMNGEVVGMITMNDNYNNCFAITSNEIKLIVENILNDASANKYQLNIKGSYIKDMPSYKKANLNINIEVISGLYIEKIMNNSICSSIGMKTGDIILSINDVTINNLNDYLKVLYTHTDSFVFKVLRDNNELEFKVDIND